MWSMLNGSTYCMGCLFQLVSHKQWSSCCEKHSLTVDACYSRAVLCKAATMRLHGCAAEPPGMQQPCDGGCRIMLHSPAWCWWWQFQLQGHGSSSSSSGFGAVPHGLMVGLGWWWLWLWFQNSLGVVAAGLCCTYCPPQMQNTESVCGSHLA